MNLDDVTPLLITWNEAANLRRTLDALHWARRIVVVDSGSTDGTCEMLRADPRIHLLTRTFDSFAGQCASGLAAVSSPFVLSLDADHVMTPGLVEELRALDSTSAQAWAAPFRYCIEGLPLRSSLLPPRVILFHRDSARYENDGHAHRVVTGGRVARLREALLHDDRKPLARWLASQLSYAPREAEKLLGREWRNLGWADRLRKLGLAPWIIVPYCLFVRGLVFDGRRGMYYTAQRQFAEILLLLHLLDRALVPRR